MSVACRFDDTLCGGVAAGSGSAECGLDRKGFQLFRVVPVEPLGDLGMIGMGRVGFCLQHLLEAGYADAVFWWAVPCASDTAGICRVRFPAMHIADDKAIVPWALEQAERIGSPPVPAGMLVIRR